MGCKTLFVLKKTFLSKEKRDLKLPNDIYAKNNFNFGLDNTYLFNICHDLYGF